MQKGQLSVKANQWTCRGSGENGQGVCAGVDGADRGKDKREIAVCRRDHPVDGKMGSDDSSEVHGRQRRENDLRAEKGQSKQSTSSHVRGGSLVRAEGAQG